VDHVDGAFILRAADVVITETAEALHKKRRKRAGVKRKRSGVRLMDDYLRRTIEASETLIPAVRRWRPDLLVVEEYTPNKGQSGGRALSPTSMKTERLVGLADALALVWGIELQHRRPGELPGATKLEIQAEVSRRVLGAQGKLISLGAAERREHVGDAIAHAVLGLEWLLAGEAHGNDKG